AHGLDFDVRRFEMLQGAAAGEVVAVVQGPDAYAGFAQARQVQRMAAFGRCGGGHRVRVLLHQRGESGVVEVGGADVHGASWAGARLAGGTVAVRDRLAAAVDPCRRYRYPAGPVSGRRGGRAVTAPSSPRRSASRYR